MQNNLQTLIQLLEQKIKIEEVISNYVNLERKGNNFVGLCPFHADSNPSMSVSPQKGIFKCFSCQAGGNAITFIQNYEGISFIDAVKKLSDKTNIDWRKYLTDKMIKIDPAIQAIWDINKEAQNFFSYSLTTNKDANKYLEQRNLSKEVITEFGIGWSGELDELNTYLIKKGFSNDQIVKAGLGKIVNEKVNSYFVRRLMFPIHDQNGNTIGFSGRIIDDSKYAKYLNTPETRAFIKGKFLYNLNKAQSPISLKGSAIIVEGFMDVIAYFKINIKNVIATMGTAFTIEHNKLLSKITNKYILSFDKDAAGINAVIKSGKEALNSKISVMVVLPQKGKDVDEYLSLSTSEEVEENLSKAEKFTSFVVSFLFKTAPSEPSFQKIREVLEIISKTNDPLEKDYFVGKIANFYSINKDIIEDQLKNIDKQKEKEIITQKERVQKKRVEKNDQKVLIKALQNKELEIVKLLLINSSLKNIIKDTHYLFHTKVGKYLYELVSSNIIEDYFDIEKIRSQIENKSLLGIFNELLVQDERDLEIISQEILFFINDCKDNWTNLSKLNNIEKYRNEEDPDNKMFLKETTKKLS